MLTVSTICKEKLTLSFIISNIFLRVQLPSEKLYAPKQD